MKTATIISFIACTLTVALVSWYKTRSVNLTTVKGLFLGGKSNNYLLVAGSLLLTNLSANQFIGENESVYINNMSVMAWGVTSVFAIILVSEFLLPVYFDRKMITTPDFLAHRYDEGTKKLVSVIILLSYVVNLLPPVLYGGAVAMTGMFSLNLLFDISYMQSIWIMVWVIGLIGGVYTILGGLKAISVSDTAIGAGLLLVAVSLPCFAFYRLGDGDILRGISLLLSKHTHHLNAVGSASDAVPFSTVFTGMVLVNIYYWGMEQYIVQQALASRTLKDAQKGMALTAFGKLLTPVLINLPGLIAVHLYPHIGNTASVFPVLASDVLPAALLGLTGALVFGAAITTYNAGLHGSSTLFVMNIYRPYFNKRGTVVSEKELVRTGKLFELVLSLIAMLTAPLILFVNSGFYTYLQKVAGLFSIPVFTVVTVGFLSRKVPPVAAKAGLFFYMISYFLCEFVMDVKLHFLHVLAILFLATTMLMLLLGHIIPDQHICGTVTGKEHDVTTIPWRSRHWVSLILLLMMAALYVFFSPWGVAR